ncbi:ferritin family protein [Candidatus Omnitrophota bacterium]
MAENILLAGLNKALEMEEKGYQFYQEVSARSKNKITQKTFALLANNEAVHIKDIKNFYNTLKERGEFPDFQLAGTRDKGHQDDSLFLQNTSEWKDKIKPTDDDKEACKVAMELENSAFKYYENMLKEAKDENLIKLLKFLLGEEDKHYQWIANLNTYLNDSANWYMYEEGSFPQGG